MILEDQEAAGKIKLVKGAMSAPLLDVDNPRVLGVDRWRQVDFLNPSETNLMVAVGVAEHPTKSVWETSFWWHEVTLVLDGELTVQDMATGAVYKAGKGDLFYWASGLRARMEGKYRCYYVKTPTPTRWVKTSEGKRGLEVLKRDDDESALTGAPPDEIRMGKSEAQVLSRPPWPRIKLIRGATNVRTVKVDRQGADENWWQVAVVGPMDSDLTLSASFANHRSKGNLECDHRWHQMVLVLGGEMISENLDTGEVFKAQEGDFFYWAPGLRHTVGGEFNVLAVKTIEPKRWIMTPDGKLRLDLFQLENEILYPGSPPEYLSKMSI